MDITIPITRREWVFQLPHRLAGQVSHLMTIGHVQIELLNGVEVPLLNGDKARKFFSRNAPEGIVDDTYVSFEWEQPGKKGTQHPVAINLSKISQEEADQLTEELRQALARSIELKVQELESLLAQEDVRIRNAETEAAGAASRQYDAKFAGQQAKQAELDTRSDQLDGQEKEVDDKLHQMQQLRAEFEPFRRFLPDTVAFETDAEVVEGYVPDGLAKLFPDMLAARGVAVPKEVATSFLLSAVTAAYMGRFVLLNGPVGVGKSSIVQKAAQALNCVAHVTPVRPAWLDPSDLLGFFDPINRSFQPTPFLTALLKPPREKLYLMCLDELNLARIENYGADLLSCLEYTRTTAGSDLPPHKLQLYSHTIFEDLVTEYNWLSKREATLDAAQAIRLRRLGDHLGRYQDQVSVPETVLLLGTLNSDATTNDLSPKVIDRSFVITFPIAGPTSSTRESTTESPSCCLTFPLLRKEIEARLEPAGAMEKKLLGWNEELANYGIPLSHRAVHDLQAFCAAARWLGVSEKDAFGYFIYTRVLPRIHFFKEDGQGKAQRFVTWFKETVAAALPFTPAEVTRLTKQADNPNQQYVRYWSDRT